MEQSTWFHSLLCDCTGTETERLASSLLLGGEMIDLPWLCFRHGAANVTGKTMETSSTGCNKLSLRFVPVCDLSDFKYHKGIMSQLSRLPTGIQPVKPLCGNF